MTIQLTPDQLKVMKRDFRLDSQDSKNPPDYAGMYDYIHRELGSQMDTEQAYWFEQAAEINEYLNDVDKVPPTQSAYFIQQINIESLKSAGKPFTEENIARISKRKVS